MEKLDQKIRKKVNDRLRELGAYYKSPGLALCYALEVLEGFGLSFGLVYVPKTGTTRVLINGESEIENSLLIVQTHEMQSGNIEALFYLS